MRAPPFQVYTFGPFRLDVRERRLLRDGVPVPLTGKAFDTLLVLVEGAGTLQRSQDLIDRLWPDVVVEPNNLQYNVSVLRRALSGVQDIQIETVRGQGYRLLADVRAASDAADGAAPPPASRAAAEGPAKQQRMHFCAAHDGARLAYARLGDGPPLVKAANWLSHLEFDWNSPVWKHWLELFSRERCFLRYDARGNGLSDWKPPRIAFPDFVDDLAAVFDAAGVERAPVLGISQGAAIAIAYAARHPERVSALILVGGGACGWRLKSSTALRERMEAMMVLMRQGWGGENAAFRQIFTTSFFPDAYAEVADWFNELQRMTTSPANAAAILSALGDLDIREDLPRVRVPVLVVHSRGDAVVPFKQGIELASGIPGARFVPLESRNHLLLENEPAWHRFQSEVETFLRETGV